MKLFKNKFFLVIVFLILSLFSLQFYFISNSYKRDTNSYVTLINGVGFIERSGDLGKKVLKKDNKTQIFDKDTIYTLNNSLAVIEWGDKSITRLGGKSKIVVNENSVNEDLSKINISFELLEGQTWSNVVSMLTGKSYFKQKIKGTTAAVRGTVFEANYDNDYMIVHKHQVKVTNESGETKNIFPGEVFSLKDFSLEKIVKFVDESFIKLNENLDAEYLKTLRENFVKSINSMNLSNPLNLVKNFGEENKIYDMLISGETKEKINDYISKLPEDKKQKIINNLLTLNQTLNFENGEDSLFYNLKINVRGLLLDNSNDKEYKETLVKYSMYDLTDIFSLKKFNEEIFNNTMGLIYNNKEYIDSSKQDLKVLGEKYEIINQILSINKDDFTLENVKNKLLELDKSGKELLNDGLNKLLDIYKK